MADEVLLHGVQGITELITTPGLINTDFADVKMIMSNAGTAIMGVGSASGDSRATTAAKLAVTSPLLEASIEGARGHPAQHRGRPGPGPVRGQRSGGDNSRCRPSRCQYHFRPGHRRGHGRRGARDGYRRRLRPLGGCSGQPVPMTTPLHRPAGRWAFVDTEVELAGAGLSFGDDDDFDVPPFLK